MCIYTVVYKYIHIYTVVFKYFCVYFYTYIYSCTDDEIGDMFAALGVNKDGHIHFEEFVTIVRSKAATGTLFHRYERKDSYIRQYL